MKGQAIILLGVLSIVLLLNLSVESRAIATQVDEEKKQHDEYVTYPYEPNMEEKKLHGEYVTYPYNREDLLNLKIEVL